MAKTGMLCPFSGKLCVDCSLYRGRHYFMCYCSSYRGYLGPSKAARKSTSRDSAGKSFEIPPIKASSAIDPFPMLLKELKERSLTQC
jgi:hypothetical protein